MDDGPVRQGAADSETRWLSEAEELSALVKIMQTGASNTYLLSMRVAVTTPEQAAACILDWAGETVGRYICVANVHMCMETFDDPVFRQKVNQADLVVPDGRPLVWGLHLFGHAEARQVRGPDLFLDLCGKAAAAGIPIGLYGGTPGSLEDLQIYLRHEFPGLRITCAISPPFRPLTAAEDEACCRQIDEAGVRILFVGIGCPKQENWMAAHRGKLSCVMLGVGAAFDLFSGRKRQAPRWMQQAGLEWAFRLACNPRRLWKRYLKHNPRFIWHIGRQVVHERIFNKASRMLDK